MTASNPEFEKKNKNVQPTTEPNMNMPYEELDFDARTKLAHSPTTPPEVLQRLSEDPDTEIRIFAILNPSTPEHARGNTSPIIRRPPLYCAYALRMRMGGSPHTPQPMLLKLAGDENYSVRGSVAANPTTPLETLERLADSWGVVRKRAQKNLAERNLANASK